MNLSEEYGGFPTHRTLREVPVEHNASRDDAGLSTKAILTEVIPREVTEVFVVHPNRGAALLAGEVLGFESPFVAQFEQALGKVGKLGHIERGGVGGLDQFKAIDVFVYGGLWGGRNGGVSAAGGRGWYLVTCFDLTQ